MKFYKHYKNKPYKYLGEVKHSETLEDLVLYETLYENPNAKLWVRPKKMFFETINLDGNQTARFQKVDFNFESIEDVTDEHIKLIAPLMQICFGSWDAKGFYSKFQNHNKYNLQLVSIEKKLVGFKLGYELDKDCFYSWLGAVLPDYQRLGLASELMRLQHEWCTSKHYLKVQTKTQNHFKAMLLLNIKSGFNILGTYLSENNKLKILLEKNL